jgi:hypothetical protein
MDLQERISSCRHFAAGTCPNQPLMERAYLVPQLMDRSELARCERLLCPCEQNLDSTAESVSPGIVPITFPFP